MQTLKSGLSPKLLNAPALEPQRQLAAWAPATYWRSQEDRAAMPATWAFSALAALQYEARPTFNP